MCTSIEEENLTSFNLCFLNTNARSLLPKINSFIESFNENDCTFAVITETWLSKGSQEKIAEDLLLGNGTYFMNKGRKPGTNGVCHGGVAIAARHSCSDMSEYVLNNPENFELISACGYVRNVGRKFFIIGAYVPPNYSVPKGKQCLECIYNNVMDIKNKFPDCYLVIAGDFNQWEIGGALADFPDLWEVNAGPTRGDRRIDRVLSNLPQEAVSAILPPLEAESTVSDHQIVRTTANIPCRPPSKWIISRHRKTNKDSEAGFVAAMEVMDWSPVLQEISSDDKASAFQKIIDKQMDVFFPYVTTRRREGDLPWLDAVAKKKIKKKKAVYRDEGKSERWFKVCENLEKYLKMRRESFLENQRNNMCKGSADKHFHKNVKNYQSFEKPKQFNVADIMPNETESTVAEAAADYFNAISKEFRPLKHEEIPTSHDREIPELSVEQVAEQLRIQKKPGSMVKGDIFPKLINSISNSIAVPLTSIFNELARSKKWPKTWKTEYVTLIPKKSTPSAFSDMRNISCTSFYSKVFESFLLKWAMEEVSVKKNQYGGVKGKSTSHMLLEIWQQICSNGEDYRSATVLTSIDYAKAFNRLSYQECLASFKKKGASTPVIALIATFLTDRVMTVRVGKEWSLPRSVDGGCPQGSILGVFLFNVTTDDLEDDFTTFEASMRPGGGEIEILPIARNVPPHLEVPPDEIPVGTQVLRKKPTIVIKYVDDNIIIEQANFGSVVIEVVGGENIKVKSVVPSQNAFRSIIRNAVKKGMMVNASKTNMLCVSDSISYKPVAYIESEAGERISSTSRMKVLGFTFQDKPSVQAHVEEIAKKFRRRFWCLRHLKRLGFTQQELVRVYKCNILPIADYTDAVYHALLTDEMDETLENLQNSALKCIFDHRLSARVLRQKSGLTTLRKRRIEHVDRFAQKSAANPDFAHWFPLRSGRTSARSGEKYLEEYARCDRLKNSPLFFMRRRLNGKEGKVYGERNRVYREA